MTIHCSRKNIFGFTHIEGITLDVGEIAGGVSGMGIDRIGEVDDRTSKGHCGRVNGASFTAGSQARVGAILRYFPFLCSQNSLHVF